tara:strand:- start:40 stop:708 length:669 start_codon:yes stop_codon:yes gene_type:complete
MPSYKQAYDKAGGAAKLGDYASWEKKAKAWNQKKYGTTEPTAKAKGVGISKAKLAKEKMERMEPRGANPTMGYGGFDGSSRTKTESENLWKNNPAHVSLMSGNAPTDTQVNKRMSQAIESARSEESLLDGKDRRKLERKARIQDRAEKRTRKSELKGTYGKDVGKAKFKAEYASAKQKSRAAKRTSKSKEKAESKSKSSASSANQDLAMQKIDSAVKKYSTK